MANITLMFSHQLKISYAMFGFTKVQKRKRNNKESYFLMFGLPWKI